LRTAIEQYYALNLDRHQSGRKLRNEKRMWRDGVAIWSEKRGTANGGVYRETFLVGVNRCCRVLQKRSKGEGSVPKVVPANHGRA